MQESIKKNELHSSSKDVMGKVTRKQRTSQGQTQVNFSVRIDIDNWQWIVEESERTHRSKGLVINEALEWYRETETARIGQKRLIEATTGTRIKESIETAEKALRSILRIWEHQDIQDRRYEDEWVSDLKL